MQRQCLIDPKAGAPQHRDQPAKPTTVQTVADDLHDGDGLRDGRWVGRIPQALVVRRTTDMKSRESSPATGDDRLRRERVIRSRGSTPGYDRKRRLSPQPSRRTRAAPFGTAARATEPKAPGAAADSVAAAQSHGNEHSAQRNLDSCKQAKAAFWLGLLAVLPPAYCASLPTPNRPGRGHRRPPLNHGGLLTPRSTAAEIARPVGRGTRPATPLDARRSHTM
jgi:hypothetical protein